MEPTGRGLLDHLKSLSFIMVFSGCLSILSAGEIPRNILWDGGLETGFGNSFWTTIVANSGPSYRNMWSNGVVRLRLPIGTRVYYLEQGRYTIAAWVKRAPGFEDDENLSITFRVRNKNYYTDKEDDRNQHAFSFQVPSGDEWHRISRTFDIATLIRHYFHVEVSPGGKGEGILVDAVSLTPGETAPEKMRPAADVEAGFWIPEETGIYNDGDERIVELIIHNYTLERKAKVFVEIYDHREDRIKERTFKVKLPAHDGVRVKVPLDDLPYGGYRLACQVEGEPVLGDALVALLPKIDQDSFPQWGADAPLFVGEFTGRWMKKLGMKIATTISCASLGRWSKIEKEEGHYIWHDEAVDTGLKYNLEVIGYLGLKYPPPCVVQNFTKDGKITDETGFTKAFCRYVDAFVRHYAGRIRVIHLDDEIKDQGYTGDQLKRILKAAHDAAKQAAKASNTEVAIGYNIWNSKWKQFLEWMEPEYEYIDFISMNTNLRPSRAVEGLNISRAKGCYTEFYYTNGGRRSRMRTTSLILARKGGTGDHPSLFAWEMLAHAWLSRPYGTEDVKDGPIIRYGYYDMRTLGQSSYMPSAKLGLVEYDNSPTLGAQAMAMVKYAISGLRPVRDPKQPYSLEGKSTGTVKLNAFPFRDKEKAVVWIMTKDGSDLGSSWRLSGFNFKDFPPLDLYARPLQLQKDGSVVTRELPVYFCVSAHHLNACLEALQGLKGELMPHSDQRFKLEMLPYIVDVDPERKGVIRLSIVQEKGKELVVVEGIEGRPELTKPGISITKGRLQTMVLLTFDDARQLTIELTDKGCQFFWSDQNSTEKIKKREIYFVLGQGGAGRKILIQEGEKVIAGVLRKSDGEFLPDQEAPPPHDLVSNSSLVILGNVARVDLSASSGVGFSPPTGFLWKLRDGKASLESAYTLKPYAGGGTRGVQKIEMRMSIFVAKP